MDKNIQTTMTLDEAIEHAEFMANNTECEECAKEHIQLAEWLKELKEYKNKQNEDSIPIHK